ncbi:hypothetical protein [Haloarcula onubensis]|uniref:Uncharacterized protein n=1 Tax=Haloarcula onubensis TaxID=2950539 RepID=A0ABU2FNI4_9EURY|nr:hypothetical protein [Halomicroarcula sp. S3CR25-11]MDS0282318.1 hypothetical protein [Halomicroarcula sp. S3CR25-11]
MDLQATELGDLEDRLSDALDRLGELQAGTRVSSDAFFSEPFMRNHTEFDSFVAFYEHAPWSLTEPTDVQGVPRQALNDYVAATTDFESWEAMKTQAAEEEIIDQVVP